MPRFEPFWWCTPPEQFVYSHLTENPEFTCLDQPPSVEEFGRTLNLKGGFFSSGLTITSDHREQFIRCKPGGKVVIEFQEAAEGKRCYFMANIEGGKVQQDYDETTRMHRLKVTTPKSKAKGGHCMDIFWAHEQYGSYDHLMEYTFIA